MRFEAHDSVSSLEYHSFWKITSLVHLGIVLHEIACLSSHLIHWLVFQKNTFIISLWINQWIDSSNVCFQHERLLLWKIDPIIHCIYWTINHVDVDLNEEVRTFIISDFPSRLDKYVSGVPTTIIGNKFYGRVSWGE